MTTKIKSIAVPAGTSYLKEFISDLPSNCIFDKGKVGAGGTTIALTNSKNYVIAVPFLSLVENKAAQFPNLVLGVTGESNEEEIKQYIKAKGSKAKKIIVTYDSLPTVISCINPADYSLLIDEYHILFTQYSFRREAIQKVLNNFDKFASFCFMTATVLEEEFILEELKGINIVRAEWASTTQVVVNSVKCKKVKHTVAEIIRDYLEGRKEGNAYIFVNSVEFIRSMVALCGLSDENTRAIWSKHNKAEVGISRGSSLDVPKKINLLTSTCFEGCDFYDTEGNVYIISDGNSANTLVDISTSFQQIAGRIRNTKYWRNIYHIYSSTRYDGDLTYDEFKVNTAKTIENDKAFAATINSLPREYIERIKPEDNVPYVRKSGDEFVFDPNLVKIDLYNFKITKCLYSVRVNIAEELAAKGFTVVSTASNTNTQVLNMDVMEANFEEVVQLFKSWWDLFPENMDVLDIALLQTPQHKAAFVKYPFLKQAIEVLGFEGIEEAGYVISNIKRKLVMVLSEPDKATVFNLLKTYRNLKIGDFIAASEAKVMFDKIYAGLKIKKTAKGTDLEEFFEVKPGLKKGAKGVVRGYTIVRPKFSSKSK